MSIFIWIVVFITICLILHNWARVVGFVELVFELCHDYVNKCKLPFWCNM